MATFTKRFLNNASTNGQPIIVAGTVIATPTTIHTAYSGNVATSFDEIWLYANNTSTSPVLLTILFGGTGAVQHAKPITLSPQSGDVLVLAGLVLNNNLVVSAFAPQISGVSVVTISGYVNQIV